MLNYIIKMSIDRNYKLYIGNERLATSHSHIPEV